MHEYERAVDLMKQVSDQSDFVGPRSEELVNAAEVALGVTFPPTYRRFLLDFGAGGFGSFEVYGVIDANFTSSAAPNSIWYTLTERAQVSLPNQLIVIHDVGDGSLDCLDLSQADANAEAPVVTIDPGFPMDQQARTRIAPDFGTFFLAYVEQELNS